MANFCVISRILRKMYNFVIWRNPEEDVRWDARQIRDGYSSRRGSNKIVKVNGDGIVVCKKKGTGQIKSDRSHKNRKKRDRSDYI